MTSSPLGNILGREINVSALLKANDITLDVQRHLANVYAALAATVLACAFGAAADLWLHVGGLLTMVAGLGAMVWLAADQDKNNNPKRVGILLLFGLLKGFSLGPLIDMVLHVDPSILVTSLLATTTVFVCFAGAAIFAKRRSYLYLGGLLSSVLSVLMVASLLNLFMRLEFLMSIQLYGGLAVFCGYVIFDTQLVVEKATLGERDFAWHAAELFIDFVGIFVRICIILMRNKDKEGNRSSSRLSSSSSSGYYSSGSRTGRTARR
ncbi:unnamed protein product [Ectocarpus sp. CCAP 1310/34]|nr:unnamed protein product [Ectocarpus sp. CCAP 1310/34]